MNATLAEKLIAERNKEYQVAKRISKALEQVTRGLNRQAVSVPPRGTAAEMKQVVFPFFLLLIRSGTSINSGLFFGSVVHEYCWCSFKLEMWRKYIQWEKSNPSGTEEYAQYAKRGCF